MFLKVHLGKVGVLYQGKGGGASVCEQGCIIAIYMQGARQKEIGGSLRFLNIISTLDIAQILKETGEYSRFPECQVLRWGKYCFVVFPVHPR